MSFTAKSIVDRARAIWKDADKVTFSEPNSFLWISDAILEARSKRSDARQDDDGEITDYTDVTSNDDVIPMNVKFRVVLVDYVVARGFMEDGDSQSHSERADKHFKLFYERIMTI